MARVYAQEKKWFLRASQSCVTSLFNARQTMNVFLFIFLFFIFFITCPLVIFIIVSFPFYFIFPFFSFLSIILLILFRFFSFFFISCFRIFSHESRIWHSKYLPQVTRYRNPPPPRVHAMGDGQGIYCRRLFAWHDKTEGAPHTAKATHFHGSNLENMFSLRHKSRWCGHVESAHEKNRLLDHIVRGWGRYTLHATHVSNTHTVNLYFCL